MELKIIAKNQQQKKTLNALKYQTMMWCCPFTHYNLYKLMQVELNVITHI